MAEESSFFNSVNGDRQYDMEQFATYFKQFLSNGIYHTNNVPALRVNHASGLQSQLEPGSAYIEGFMYRNTDNIVFTHESGDSTNPRIDRIVLRLDRGVNARHIIAVVKKGEASTNPQPPGLTRNDVVYEISLAQIRINASSNTINNVTDERLDSDVAGLVSSLITIPTDQFLEDWNSWMSEMNQRKQNYQQEWENWFSGIQEGNPAMGGMTFYVGDTPPSNPVTNDRWLDTSD